MATINLYEAYQAKLRKLGYTSSALLQDSFVDAVNLVYAELNDQIFRTQSLGYIGSFDDVIDSRLIGADKIDFDGTGVIEVTSNRDYFKVEWDIEVFGGSHDFVDRFRKSSADILSFTLNDGTFTITNAAVTGVATLPDSDVLSISFESDSSGNRLRVNDGSVAIVYSVGDEDTVVNTGAIDERYIDNIGGVAIKRTRLLSPETVLYNFLFNEGTGTTSTDEVAAYSATLTNPVWKVVWIEPSSGLDNQYRAVFNMGIDYHLQDGGQWAVEPEVERERKWYGRGLSMARNILQNNTAYQNPLGL